MANFFAFSDSTRAVVRSEATREPHVIRFEPFEPVDRASWLESFSTSAADL